MEDKKASRRCGHGVGAGRKPGSSKRAIKLRLKRNPEICLLANDLSGQLCDFTHELNRSVRRTDGRSLAGLRGAQTASQEARKTHPKPSVA